MNPVLEKLLSQVYELEGLLLVLERHRDDSPTFIYDMIQQKVARINEIAPSCTPDIFPSIKMETSPSVPEPEEDQTDDTLPEQDIQEPETEPEQDDTEEYNTFLEPAEDEPREDESIEIEPVEPDADEADEEDDFEDAPACDDDNENENNYDDEPGTSVSDTLDDNFPTDDNEAIKLDEALQRSLSKDLSRAFTLNDRFRYRRELFGNSEVEMHNTLDMVETMHSFSEAEEYFYGDLEWDRDSPEVADFMTIIRNHFL